MAAGVLLEAEDDAHCCRNSDGRGTATRRLRMSFQTSSAWPAVAVFEDGRQKRLIDKADEAAVAVADPLDGSRCLHR